MRRFKTVLAMLGVTAGLALAPAQAHAATNYFCNEYSGDEFLISTSQSYRMNSTTIHLAFQSDLPVHVTVYASNGAGVVTRFDMNSDPVGNHNYPGGGPDYVVVNLHSTQGHWWSAGSAAFDTIVPNSWYSSLHRGNSCASNSVWIPGA
jgi:hypothetical protein